MLHQVVLDAGEGVPHAGALLEARVLVMRMVSRRMLAMLAAVVSHQGLVGLQRVLVGVTAGIRDVIFFLYVMCLL